MSLSDNAVNCVWDLQSYINSTDAKKFKKQLWFNLLLPNRLTVRKYKIVFKFIRNNEYWGIKIKIKCDQGTFWSNDPLYLKRCVQIIFENNGEMCNRIFINNLSHYGYNKKRGQSYFIKKVLSHDKLKQNATVKCWIDFKIVCPCTPMQIQTNKFDNFCEIHKNENKLRRKQRQSLISEYFKKKNMKAHNNSIVKKTRQTLLTDYYH